MASSCINAITRLLLVHHFLCAGLCRRRIDFYFRAHADLSDVIDKKCRESDCADLCWKQTVSKYFVILPHADLGSSTIVCKRRFMVSIIPQMIPKMSMYFRNIFAAVFSQHFFFFRFAKDSEKRRSKLRI